MPAGQYLDYATTVSFTVFPDHDYSLILPSNNGVTKYHAKNSYNLQVLAHFLQIFTSDHRAVLPPPTRVVNSVTVTDASYKMGTGYFPEVKRQGRGVDHPPSSGAEVKERAELYLYSPSGVSWPVLR